MKSTQQQHGLLVIQAGAENWDKVDFFRALDATEDESNDELTDEGFVAAARFFQKTTLAAKPPDAEGRSVAVVSSLAPNNAKTPVRKVINESIVSETPRVLSRSISAPDSLQQMRPNGSTARITETPLLHGNLAEAGQLRRVVTAPLPVFNTFDMALAAAPKAGGKRKRDQPVEKVPEARQIFKDLVFYFFPNNDTNTRRRMRIAIALQFGAAWTKDWCVGITHVIVDDNLNYQDLLKYLKVEKLPDYVALVNENYTPDCLSYCTLVNYQQKRYEVPGAPQGRAKLPEQPMQHASVALSPSSRKADIVDLPLKPPGPSRTVREPGTPQGSAEGSQRAIENAAASMNPLDSPFKEAMVPESPSYEDALSTVIEEARSLRVLSHLDLEDDVLDGDFLQASSDEDESETEGRPSSSKRQKKKWQENFQCMEKHDGTYRLDNPNLRVIEVLEQMAEYYDRTHDQWRTVAYRRAIATLRRQSKRITYKEDAMCLPFVGERLASKIEEIAWTDRLKRLDNALEDPTDMVLCDFMNIYGVGLSQAHRWVKAGYKTLQDLLKYAKLSENQRIGIAHFKDFQTRIPRGEVERHGAIVRDALRQLDPGFEVTVMGSYRRGACDSGDIDLIITKPDADIAYIRHTVIDVLVPKLTAQGFFKAALSRTHKDTGTKWHGCSALPDIPTWRRIDLLLVPWGEMGAALIYFTGNDIFNRSIRLLASKKGMRLNQRGLYKDVWRVRGREKMTDGELVEGESEKKIFEILGVPWRPPEHRIC